MVLQIAGWKQRSGKQLKIQRNKTWKTDKILYHLHETSSIFNVVYIVNHRLTSVNPIRICVNL